MFNKDKIKGFVSGLCVALVISSGTVFADSLSKTVTAVYNNIKIVIDGKEITPKDANGNTVEPFIIDGTTYLPVRAVSEALGKEVDWDGTSNTVYIGKKPEKEIFSVEMSTLEPFSDKELLSVNSNSVSGGMVNFYVSQDANDRYMYSFADNYSPSGNLQTLTIDSIPAAKVLTESAVDNLITIFAVCDEAEKIGYINDEDVKKDVEALWTNFKLSFDDNYTLSDYAKDISISEADLETLARKSFLFENYINSIYEKNIALEVDTEELEKEIKAQYITAKHILVEDEALANEIIKKLSQGEDFNALMKEYNIDPGATEEGYTFTKGEMVSEFETAAYALNENTYTKVPVKTSYGFHIIYRMPFNEKFTGEAILMFKDAVAQETTTAYIDSLKAKAAIKYTPDYETYLTTIK